MPANHPFHMPGTFDPPSPIFYEAGYPKMHFIEREYADDWTNWWAPNAACSEAMLRAAGFAIEAHPEAEVFLCPRRARALRQRMPPARWPSIRYADHSREPRA